MGHCAAGSLEVFARIVGMLLGLTARTIGSETRWQVTFTAFHEIWGAQRHAGSVQLAVSAERIPFMRPEARDLAMEVRLKLCSTTHFQPEFLVAAACSAATQVQEANFHTLESSLEFWSKQGSRCCLRRPRCRSRSRRVGRSGT
jgi:hypothetical protein